MKIVRYNEIKPEEKPDGRKIYSLIRHPFSGNAESKLFRVEIPKGVREKEHLHTNSEEIFIFLKPGQIIINKKVYDFKEGDVIILEKNDKHQIIAKKDMEIIGIKNPDVNDKIVTENETN